MSASLLDKLTDTRNAARPNAARVTSTRASGGNSLACDNLAGWPTASAVYFVTYSIDSSSKLVPGTQLDCVGIVAGNTIGSFTVIDGSDNGNSIGDYVVMLPTASWGQALIDALLVSHDRTGKIKAGAISDSTMFGTGVVDAAAIAADSVGTSEIAPASVTANELATGIQTSNVQVTETTTSTSYTGLTTPQAVTVTVGANGILVLAYGASNVKNDTNAGMAWMTPVLSGANTLAATDSWAAHSQSVSSNVEGSVSRTVCMTGLTSGSTTVTMQFCVRTGGAGAGTGLWQNRTLLAWPL